MAFHPLTAGDVERVGALRRLCLGKARTVLPPGVTQQGELADEQHSAVNILDAAVHLAFIIRENAQLGDFIAQILRVLFRVPHFHAQQDHQALPDLACYAALY